MNTVVLKGKIQMNKLMFCFILFCSAAQTQQVYVSTDKNGVPLYSDLPGPGATKLQLKVSTLQRQPPQIMLSDPMLTSPSAKTTYQLTVLEPAPQQTVISNLGEVIVRSSVAPELPDSHQLRLILDHNQQSPSQKSANFRLLGVERGEHQLQLQALDQNGKLIAESPVTTFYLRKNSIASPN